MAFPDPLIVQDSMFGFIYQEKRDISEMKTTGVKYVWAC